MQLHTSVFSTGGERPAQQYDRFREAVSSTHLAWDMASRGREAFHGTIHQQPLGSAEVSRCACDPCRGRRGPREIASTPRAMFGVLCLLSGRERLTGAGREADLREGMFMLWDAARPLAFDIPGALRKVTLLLPEDVIVAAIPDAHAHTGVAFDATAGCGALFVSQLQVLSRLERPLSPAEHEVALRTTLELLAAAVGPSPALPRSASAADVIGRVVRDVRSRLADPGLTAESLARAVGLSRRQLDRVFGSTGFTIMRWVWRERLHRCRRDMVLEPRASLTEIAFRWGFNDAAHFSRAFRREFGASPRQVRARAAGRTAPDDE